MKKAIYILFLIVFQQLVFSQFQMPDTSLSRGKFGKLLLKWDGELPRDSNIFSFKLKYDLNMIEILSISTEIASPYKFNFQNNLSTDGSYIMFDGALANTNNPFVAEIEFEALAGPDSVTFFTIDSLNGNPYSFDNHISRISISDPILKSNVNSIGEPFPNPFQNELFLNVIIEENTIFEAKIFNYSGRLVALEDKIAGIEMFLYDEMNNIVDFGVLEPGEYQLKTKINGSKLSNGFYFLSINLGGELIYKPIVMAN